MNTTSASLLEKIRMSGEQAAWERFVKLYTPLLFYWAKRLGLEEHDAADFVQDIFVTLLRALPVFEYDRTLGFRKWLCTIFVNKWRDRCRRGSVPTADGDALANVAAPDIQNAFAEAEYRQYLAKRAMELMQIEFPEKIWKACWEHLVVDRPAAEVASELNIAVGTVYVAKARVLRHLREELGGLLD